MDEASSVTSLCRKTPILIRQILNSSLFIGIFLPSRKAKERGFKCSVYESKGIYITEFWDGVIVRNTWKVWKCGAEVGWKRSV
jgi:hypothetical protein